MGIFHSHPSIFPSRHFLLPLSSSTSHRNPPTATAASAGAPGSPAASLGRRAPSTPALPVLLLSARVLCSTSQPWWLPAPCSLLHDQQRSAAPSLLLLASGCSREQELPGRPAHPQRPIFFMAASSSPPSWRFPPMDNVPPLRSRSKFPAPSPPNRAPPTASSPPLLDAHNSFLPWRSSKPP